MVADGGVVTGSEAMGYPSVMHVYLLTRSKQSHDPDPISATWQRGGREQLGCMHNTASIRAPVFRPVLKGECDTSALTVASKAAMARDLATAFARVHAGGYREIHICDNLLKAAALPQNEHLGKLIDEFTTHRNDIPPFAKEMDLDFLIADFEKRFRRGRRDLRTVTVMCGVSGEFVGLRATGCAKEENMVMVEVCKENAATLRRVFPKATILCGDIRDKAVQDALIELRGTVDIGFVSMLCQPASDAATVHDPEDLRLGIGVLAVMLMTAVRPNIMMVENVASFERRCPNTHRDVREYLESQYAFVRSFLVDAKYCGAAQGRNRLFIIGCSGPTTETCEFLSRLKAQVKKQRVRSPEGEYKGDAACDATIADRLAPYLDGKEGRPNIKNYDGIFLPWIRGCPHKAGKPKRIYSLQKRIFTTTGHYGLADR